MGEVIEISILSDNDLCDELVTVILELFPGKFELDTIEIMDDWKYSNSIRLKNLSEINSYKKNKIISIKYVDDQKNQIGINQEYIKGSFITEGWINLKEDIGEKNYFSLLKKVEENLNRLTFSLCAVGQEIIVDFELPAQSIIARSHNVDLWIDNRNLPEDIM
jgi:hypothetical protein